MTVQALPLSGVTVLDFSSLLPGPLATLMLAEAGAEIVKVERPEGDGMRREPADFAQLNRGKQSICVDMKSAGVFERLRPLIERADVVVEQFRPGVMDRLGFGFDALHGVNPKLIYCSINGYGSSGPNAMKAGHDLTYAAESGILAQTAGIDGAPSMPQVLVADIGAGAYPAVINILLALLQRERTGVGSRIEIAMYDNLFPFLQPCFAAALGRGVWPQSGRALETGGSPRYNIYRTADGRYLAAAPAEQKFWDLFCDAIDLPAAARDDSIDPDATRAAVASIVASRSATEWQARFGHRDVACAIVKTFEEALADPHFAGRRLLHRRVSLGADVSLPALPVAIEATLRRDDIDLTAPQLGADNERLLGAAKEGGR
jgi:alpha-methylacyl-CoA racemase